MGRYYKIRITALECNTRVKAVQGRIVHHLIKTLPTLLFYMLYSTGIVGAELPHAADRPFWTQKTCYRQGNTVYGVGLSMGETSLESARKKSFEAALWEIANYAQISDTSHLLFETQMTYEEQNTNSTFSVWRLVKIPFDMLKNSKITINKKALSYGPFVDRIQKLEKKTVTDLDDDLRHLLTSEDKSTAEKGRGSVSDRQRYQEIYGSFGKDHCNRNQRERKLADNGQSPP